MKKLRDTINEMKIMLNDKTFYTLTDYINEPFVLPENFEEGGYEDETPQMQPSRQEQPQGNENVPVENKIRGIEKELTQIRKIALNVITRLADQPSSEQYLLMKKIWNTVDKAIENGNEKTENV